MSQVAIAGVEKHLGGRQVLRGIDLEVKAGQLTAILGPSGCGKTTLLRAIAGFDRPDRGSIAIGGRIVADDRTYLPPEARRIGYVPQECALFPHLTAAENVAFGLPRRDRRGAPAAAVLELTGMSALGARMPHELSGGQQQRIALARALAPAPDLVLLDEPFNALDARLRTALREEVREVLRRVGATSIVVTHDEEEALSIADLVAVMRDGRVVQATDPMTIYRHPIDLDVAGLSGQMSLLPAVSRGAEADTAIGALPVCARARHLGGAVTAMLRPEQIMLVPPASGPRGRVVRATFFGPSSLVWLATAGHEEQPDLLVRIPGGTHCAPGDEIGLRVRGEVMIYPPRAR